LFRNNRVMFRNSHWRFRGLLHLRPVACNA
jgi:hypothetical protein